MGACGGSVLHAGSARLLNMLPGPGIALSWKMCLVMTMLSSKAQAAKARPPMS